MKYQARLAVFFLLLIAGFSAAPIQAQPVDCSTLKGPAAKSCATQQLRDITQADREFKRELRKAFKSMTKGGGK